MTVPLIVLAVPSLLSGFWGSPLMGNGFGAFMEGHAVEAQMEPVVMVGSALVALAGIGLAWLMYGAKRLSPDVVSSFFRPVYELLVHKYWIDELYLGIVRVAVLGGARLLWVFDSLVVDGAVNGVGSLARRRGRLCDSFKRASCRATAGRCTPGLWR